MHFWGENLEDFTFNLPGNCLHANKFYVKMSGVEGKNVMCVQRGRLGKKCLFYDEYKCIQCAISNLLQ